MLSSKVEAYQKAFGKDDPLSAASRAQNMISEKAHKLEKREKCYKKIKSDLSSLRGKYKKETNKLKNTVEDLNQELASLKTDNDNLNNELRTLKKRLQDMTTQQRDNAAKIETMNIEHQANMDELTKKATEDKVRLEAEMADEIRRVSDNLAVTADNFEGSQQQINQPESCNHTARS